MFSQVKATFKQSPLYQPYERLAIWWKYRRHVETIQWRGGQFQVRTPNKGNFNAARNFLRLEGDLLESLASHTGSEDVFWDVGANIGLFSLALAPLAKAVHSFEPEKGTHATLQANLDHNNFRNVTAHETALFSENTELELHASSDSSKTGTHSLFDRGDVDLSRNIQKIPAMRGDDFLTKHNVEAPNVLKIDVEGAEFDVLQGMPEILARPETRFVAVELHPVILKKSPEDALQSLCDLVLPHGFTMLQADTRGSETQVTFAKT